MKRNLRDKREVIITNAAESINGEQSSPSQQVLELKRKVTRLEREKKSALRTASHAQALVDFQRNLHERERVALDNKTKKVARLEKSVASLTRQLAEEKSRSEEYRLSIRTMLQQRARSNLTQVLQQQARSNLAHLGRIGEYPRIVAQRGVYEQLPPLQPQPSPSRQQQPDIFQMRPQEWITRKSAQRPQPPPQYPQGEEVISDEYTTNLLELASSSPKYSISYKSAADQLRVIYDTNFMDGCWYAGYLEAVKFESLNCTVCNNRRVSQRWILNHFFSAGHIQRVRAHHAAVSRVAFEYWKQKLKSITRKVDNVNAVDEMPMESVNSIEQPVLFEEVKEEDEMMKQEEKEEAVQGGTWENDRSPILFAEVKEEEEALEEIKKEEVDE